MRIVDSPEMMFAAERIARRLGLWGFFGLDFMIDDDTGASHLIEMNPRCTPLCHLRLGQGSDMIGALWERLSGQSLGVAPCVTRNDLIAYFPQAWHCKSEFLRTGFQDVPHDEPDLMKDLLERWPDGGLLARGAHRLRRFGARE